MSRRPCRYRAGRIRSSRMTTTACISAWRAEREIVPQVRVGASAGWDHVSFLGSDDRFVDGGVDVVVDTRIDPMLSRNVPSMCARRWTICRFRAAARRTGRLLEGRALIVGLVWSDDSRLFGVLLRRRADRSLPPVLQPLLGGMDTLRGFPGWACRRRYRLPRDRDELRVPLIVAALARQARRQCIHGTSEKVVQRGRYCSATGPSAERGVGGSVWFSAAVFRLKPRCCA